MRTQDWRNGPHGMAVVKCACGLSMRAKNWEEHWRTCKSGSSVDVAPQDIKDLEYHEGNQRVRRGEPRPDVLRIALRIES